MTGPRQLSLLDAPATRGASRVTDPATSREAGRSIAGDVLGSQQALVLHAADVCTRHGDGGTAFEMWSLLVEHGNRIKENVVSKRLGELRERGWVRLTGETRPGSSSRQQQVYKVTPEGHDAWVAHRAAVAA